MSPAVRGKRIFVAAVAVGGFGVLGLASGPLGHITPYTSSPTHLLLWMIMITLGAVSPVPSPRGRSAVSLLPALDVGALLIFGPAPACWLGIISRMVAGFVEKWSPFEEHLLELVRAPLAIGVAGLVHGWLGGFAAAGSSGLVPSVGALFASVTCYTSIKIWTEPDLAPGRPRSDSDRPRWSRAIRTGAREFLTVPFGILLYLTQGRMGLLGVAAFFLPLFLARFGFKLWVDTKHAHLTTTRMLMKAVDAGDVFTRGHSQRISAMSVQVARHLRLPEKEVEEIEYAALLHDIGRTALRREILLKPGALDPGEQSELRAHPRIAYEMLRDLKPFAGAAEIVYAHHEQPDGKGYPRGLTRDEIPVGSRIIMVVAAFDAMISDRPYRPGLSPEAAFEELLAHAGTQFFPEVVEALIQLYSADRLLGPSEGRDERGESQRLSASLERPAAIGSAESGRSPLFPIPAKIGMESDRGEACDAPALIPFPQGPREDVGEPIESVFRTGRRARLVVAGLSDVGCVRETNEDAFGAFSGSDPARGCLLLVADGMGGMAAGEVASGLAVAAARQAYFEDGTSSSPDDVLVRAVEQANLAVHRHASEKPECAGMGTTCTAVAVIGTRLHLAHVGDSRAYLFHEDRVVRLSRDHNLAEELRRAAGLEGEVPGDARQLLTRCLGRDVQVEVDTEEESVRLDKKSALVLCTDGLHGLVDDEEIQETVLIHSPSESCRLLVGLARERGGIDNITVQVARLDTT